MEVLDSQALYSKKIWDATCDKNDAKNAAAKEERQAREAAQKDAAKRAAEAFDALTLYNDVSDGDAGSDGSNYSDAPSNAPSDDDDAGTDTDKEEAEKEAADLDDANASASAATAGARRPRPRRTLDAEELAQKKKVDDAYPDAKDAATSEDDFRWLTRRNPTLGLMAYTALKIMAWEDVQAYMNPDGDRPALLSTDNLFSAPLPFLFVYILILCTVADCGPQSFTNKRRMSRVVRVLSREVKMGWGKLDDHELGVGTFFTKAAAIFVGKKVRDSPALRVCMAAVTFMAREQDLTARAQAAALARAEREMRYKLPASVVAGLAALRFAEGTAEHTAMVAAVEQAWRDAFKDIVEEATNDVYLLEKTPITDKEYDEEIAEIDAIMGAQMYGRGTKTASREEKEFNDQRLKSLAIRRKLPQK